MIALFPMVANTLFGLQSVDKGQRELFKLSGAGRLTLLRKLQLPAAMPSIFVGLRTSAGLSVIGAIVGDQLFQRGTPGLGALIQVDNSRLLGPQLYAAILTASALGVVIFLLFGLLGRLVSGPVARLQLAAARSASHGVLRITDKGTNAIAQSD